MRHCPFRSYDCRRRNKTIGKSLGKRSQGIRGRDYFLSRRVVVVRHFLLAVTIGMAIGMKPIRCWRRDVLASLSRSFSSSLMLPLADAFVSKSPCKKLTRATSHLQYKTKLRYFQSSSLSPLSAVVVPELDDSFPDDNDNGERNADPFVGEDYFPGVQDFQFEDMSPPFGNDSGYALEKEEEEVVDPFSFLGPQEGATGAITRDEMKLNTPNHSVPEPVSIENSGLDDAIKKLKDNDLDDSISRLTESSSSISAATSVRSSTSFSSRTMTTVANNTKEEALPSEQHDLWQLPEVEDMPMTIDPTDQYDPFSDTMDGSRSVKPLVAPLKLSPKTKVPTDTIVPNDTPKVPSIQSNGLDDLVDSLQGQLKSTQREIEIMGGDKAKSINLNSPKQVSQLLFGRPDMSTNKSTLEGMAASNILAKLVLEYRDVKRRLNKILKQQELRSASEASSDSENSASTSSPQRAMKDPVLLFDTSSFIFRAYYSNPPIHRGRDGMPIGAVMGFCSMINKLLLTSMLKGETPILVHCLDAPGSSFRSDLYPEYKAHRPPIPLDLVPQFNLINRAVKAYGMIQIQAPGYEADDVIATLATVGSQNEGLDVKILSGDKDLMQLVTEDDASEDIGMVHMVDPMSSKVWNHDMVLEKWGVKPSQLGDVLALAGDAADNVPGVPGIGPKIAAQLLQEFGTLESLLANTDQIPQPKRREKLETNAESARISRELVELKRELEWSQMEAFHPPPATGEAEFETDMMSSPMPFSTKISDLRMQPIQPDRILAFYDEMGFHKLKNQLMERLGKAPLKDFGGRNSASQSSKTLTKSSPESATSSKTTGPSPAKSKSKRNYWEKKTRGVPRPEDYKDVPF